MNLNLNLRSLFNINRNKNKGMKLPPHLEEIRDSTNFSSKEILDFQKKFLKLCQKGSTELSMNSFVKFMRMMGVKSNATLISRIFNVMDADLSGSISFGEFMKYFDVLLRGNNDQKAEFSFMIIAVGNSKNIGKISNKMTFNHNDLYQLLKIMRESETKSIGETLDKEDIQTLKNLAGNMMGMLKVKKNQDVTLKMFKEAISSDENVLANFQKLGNGLESLMSYQGENKYTRTVRALRLVREKFEVILTDIGAIELGFTQYGIGQLIVGGLGNRSTKRKTSKTKGKTFMDGFNNTLKVTRLSKFAHISSRGSMGSGQLLNRGVNLLKDMPDNGTVGTNKDTLNLISVGRSSPEDPKVSKRTYSPEKSGSKKLRMSGIGKLDESNNQSMAMADFFEEDESNIKFDKKDGIDKTNFKKLNILNFKNDSVVDFEGIRRMVNEIEEGVYAPKNQKIQLYNASSENTPIQSKKAVKIDWKQMPTFRKVRRVPKPNSTIFEDFENFLGSRKNNDNDTTGNSDEKLDEKKEETLVKKILESEEYKKGKKKRIFFEKINSIWIFINFFFSENWFRVEE